MLCKKLLLVTLVFLSTTGYKKDHFFAANGEYSEIIEINTSMHREALEMLLQQFPHFGWAPDKTIEFLDIACGTSQPFVPTWFFNSYPQFRFHYTGVDINQSLRGTHFSFSDNVTQSTIIVDDAYQLKNTKFENQTYDIIYSGLNFHHLAVDELHYVLGILKKRLQPKGKIVVHDLVRPSHLPYMQKTEDKYLIPKEQRTYKVEVNTDETSLWRLNFIETYLQLVKSRSSNSKLYSIVRQHILENDFPLSLKEIEAAARQLGFRLKSFPLVNPSHPLAHYFVLYILELK